MNYHDFWKMDDPGAGPWKISKTPKKIPLSEYLFFSVSNFILKKRAAAGVYQGTSWNFLNKFFSEVAQSCSGKKLIQKIPRSSFVNTYDNTLSFIITY